MHLALIKGSYFYHTFLLIFILNMPIILIRGTIEDSPVNHFLFEAEQDQINLLIINKHRWTGLNEK